MTNDGVHTYTYDAEGNILTVDGGSNGQYVYDALNRRIRAGTTALAFEYLYDYAGRQTSRWKAASNQPDVGRIYWGNQQVAFRAGDGNIYFDHQDYLGTEKIRTTSTGAVAASYISLPWGDNYSSNIVDSYGDEDILHFASLDQDNAASGTPMSEHAQFRNYSFTQGRWLSPDPYDGSYDLTNPQSLNRYAYVLNNPLSFIDPSGQDCYTIGGDTWTIDSGDGTVTTGSDPGTTVCTNPGPSTSWPCQEYGYSYCGMGNGPGVGNVATPPPAILARTSAPNNGTNNKAKPLTTWEKVAMYAGCAAGLDPSYATPLSLTPTSGTPQDPLNSTDGTSGQRTLYGPSQGTRNGGLTPYNPGGNNSLAPDTAAGAPSYLVNLIQCIENVNSTWPK